MEVVPLTDSGKEITEDDDIFVEDPSELVSLSSRNKKKLTLAIFPSCGYSHGFDGFASDIIKFLITFFFSRKERN